MVRTETGRGRAVRKRGFASRVLPLSAILCIAAGLNTVSAEGREMKIAFEHDGDPVYEVIPPGSGSRPLGDRSARRAWSTPDGWTARI